MYVTGFCVFVDFFFALFPWVFLYDLEMNRKDKAIVGISLSFGVLYVHHLDAFEVQSGLYFSLKSPRSSAGACGIVRTINLRGVGSANYTGKPARTMSPPLLSSPNRRGPREYNV